jgi:hypothetical protein
MNKYRLKRSQLLFYTIVASSTLSYATSEHAHLSRVVDATRRHFCDKAVPWSNKFLNSNAQFRPLVQEFGQHVDSFDNEVVAQLHTRSRGETSKLTSMAQVIVKDVQDMIGSMYKALSSLVGCGSTISFMATMSNTQKQMSARLQKIERNLREFKQACIEQQASELINSIENLEQTIAQFKNNNNNASSALMKRIPQLIK